MNYDKLNLKKDNKNISKTTKILFIIFILFGLLVTIPSSTVHKRRQILQNIITDNYKFIDKVIVECRYHDQKRIKFKTSKVENLNLFQNLYESTSQWEGSNVGFRHRDYNVTVYFYRNNEYLYHLKLEIISNDKKVKCNYGKNLEDGNKIQNFSLTTRQYIDENYLVQTILDNIKKNPQFSN